MSRYSVSLDVGGTLDKEERFEQLKAAQDARERERRQAQEAAARQPGKLPQWAVVALIVVGAVILVRLLS
jgi:hypothetical protein